MATSRSGTATRQPDTLLPDADSPKAQTVDAKRGIFVDSRSDRRTIATSAVPAPPRTKPTPAHKLGRSPDCRACRYVTPPFAVALRIRPGECGLCFGDSFIIKMRDNRSAACHASSLVSRTITCRQYRNEFCVHARQLSPALVRFLFNQFRRFAPGEVEINLFCRSSWATSDDPPK